MHLVVNHLQFNHPVSGLAATLQDGADTLAHLPGFLACYIAREAEDRAAVIVVWESEEDATAGAASFSFLARSTQ